MDQAITIGMVVWTSLAVVGAIAAISIIVAILAFIASAFKR